MPIFPDLGDLGKSYNHPEDQVANIEFTGAE